MVVALLCFLIYIRSLLKTKSEKGCTYVTNNKESSTLRDKIAVLSQESKAKGFKVQIRFVPLLLRVKVAMVQNLQDTIDFILEVIRYSKPLQIINEFKCTQRVLHCSIFRNHHLHLFLQTERPCLIFFTLYIRTKRIAIHSQWNHWHMDVISLHVRYIYTHTH